MEQGAPNLAGVDFSQYRSWQTVKTPRGGVYYVVPGTPYVYDPFASAARGQTVLYLNPTPEIQDRERAEKVQDAQLESQSPMGQAIPVVGGVGGTLAGAYAYDKFMKPAPISASNPVVTAEPTVAPTAQPQPTVAPTTPAQGFTQGAQTGSAAVTPAGNTIPSGAPVPEGYSAVGTSADGGTIIAPTDQVSAIPEAGLNDPGFLSSINWGQVAQGGLGLTQLYGAYKSYQKGDYVGAGLTGTAGAFNVAASGMVGAGAQTAAQGVGGNLIPGLNIATGLYTGYQTADAMGDMAAGGKRTTTGVVGGASSGAALGAGIGSFVPVVGTAVGAVIGGVVGAIAGLAGDKFGSSKGKSQVMRDGIRKVLKDGKILDENYQGTLADGSKYDFGQDGSKLKWKEIDKVAAENKNAWEAAVPMGDAMAAGYGFVGQNASDVNIMYSKAAVSNANNNPEVAQANMRHFAKQQGLTYDGIKQKLDEAKRDGRIDESQYNYYIGGARALFPEASPQAPQMQKQAPGAGPVVNAAPPPGTPGAPAAAPAPALPARSRTSSPGIDLQGRRINYNVDMGKQLANRFNRRGR